LNWLYFKHLLIRTPLEGPANRLRHLASAKARKRHPELSELNLESDRVEEIMRQIIKPSSNCIDIGCHIGSSLSSIMRCAPKGKHIAFEPVPWKAKWLEKKFPEVEVKQMALGTMSEKRTFFINLSRPGFSGFFNDPSDKDVIQKVTVDCEKLDDMVSADRKFSYIKIDVEGAELFVLKGARKTIQRDLPVILFESSHDGSVKLGYHRDALYSYFVDELGYEVFKVKDYLEQRGPLSLTNFQECAVYPFQAINFLAVPKK